jgi:hypothetical protein
MIAISRDLNRLLRRHQAFWAGDEIDRPLIGVVHNLYVDPQLVASALGAGEWQPDDINPIPVLAEYDRMAHTRELIGDDLIGAAEPLMGIPWLEAICGCRVVSSGKSVWPEPPSGGVHPPEIAVDWAWREKLLEVQRAVAAHVDGRYMVSAVSHLRGTTDVLAALLGSQNFYLALYDDPQRMGDMASRVADVWRETASAQAAAAPTFRDGYGLRQFMLWAPELPVWLQDDVSGMMSSKHYSQLFLEPARRISMFPYGVFHLHIPALHIAGLVADLPNIRAINIYFDSPTVTLQDAMPTMQWLQARGVPLILGKDSFEGFTLEEYEEILDGLSSRGLCVHLKADSIEEGRSVMAYVHERAGR